MLGRGAFASISAVEGITISKSMSKQFRKLDKASPKERRAHLAATYGKSK